MEALTSRSTRKRVLLVYSSFPSFVRDDFEILSQEFEVEKFEWRGKKDVFALRRAVKRADATFSWFATDHAAVTVFFSRLNSKPSVVVIAGFDVSAVPELNYGNFTQGWFRRFLTRYALRKASRVVALDKSLKDRAVRNAHITGENIECLPTGFDHKFWAPEGEREDLVLTVGVAADEDRMRIKGLDTFARVAARMPHCRFLAIGPSEGVAARIRDLSSGRVEALGPMAREDLRMYYRKAKVYCQLSRIEGLPVSLCEAMLCGCAPVGTGSVDGIRSVIGDAGVYVNYADVDGSVKAVEEALRSPLLGEKARARIVDEFPRERRRERLPQILRELMDGDP